MLSTESIELVKRSLSNLKPTKPQSALVFDSHIKEVDYRDNRFRSLGKFERYEEDGDKVRFWIPNSPARLFYIASLNEGELGVLRQYDWNGRYTDITQWNLYLLDLSRLGSSRSAKSNLLIGTATRQTLGRGYRAELSIL